MSLGALDSCRRKTVTVLLTVVVVVVASPVSVTVMKLEQSDCRSVKGGSPDSLVPVTLRAQACIRQSKYNRQRDVRSLQFASGSYLAGRADTAAFDEPNGTLCLGKAFFQLAAWSRSRCDVAKGNARRQKTRHDCEELHCYRVCRCRLKNVCGTEYLGKTSVEGQSLTENRRQKRETKVRYSNQ